MPLGGIRLANVRLLNVDDEVQIRRLLRVTLEANGYRVLEATTGNDGIVEAAQRRPDVVVLDLGLPDLDGLRVLKRLREWSRVPGIILTEREADDEKVAALDAEAGIAPLPRANRYVLPGHVYHLIHRCHDRRFLLRFATDRNGYKPRLREARESSRSRS
ncbi:MAG: response regulator [Verrucomicrobiia bacterium]